jgi:hypothetical protein
MQGASYIEEWTGDLAESLLLAYFTNYVAPAATEPPPMVYFPSSYTEPEQELEIVE